MLDGAWWLGVGSGFKIFAEVEDALGLLELGYWELVLALDFLEVLGGALWMLEHGSWE